MKVKRVFFFLLNSKLLQSAHSPYFTGPLLFDRHVVFLSATLNDILLLLLNVFIVGHHRIHQLLREKINIFAFRLDTTFLAV